MTGIIFNSVTAFVEQVGRRLQWKYAELDNLVCTYIGPSASALQFRPPVNSAHPQYPLMFVTDSSITNKEAGIAEVSVTYQGIIRTSGQSPYYTPPIVTQTGTQGEREFQIPYLKQLSTTTYWTAVNQPGGIPVRGIAFPAYYAYGTQAIHIRYVGAQCSIRYQAYPRPSGLIYSHLGKSLVQFNVVEQFYGQISIAGQWVELAYAQQQLLNIPQTAPAIIYGNTGFGRVQKGQWYDCTETYGPIFQ